MPMERDTHEQLLTELNSPELDHTRRAEILQELRTDYSGVHTDFETISKRTEFLEKDNNDLLMANSKLFRLAGIQENPEKKKEEETKEFSETVTVSAIEKGLV